MGLKESTGIWGRTPLRWPLAIAGLSFFIVAGGFAIADEDVRLMIYTCVVMGATLIGAWIYALGSHRYSGESDETPSMLSNMDKPANAGHSMLYNDTPDHPPALDTDTAPPSP
jgi:hypothetical protein